MADNTDILNQLNNTAVINAAKYGGYSPLDPTNPTQIKKGFDIGGLMSLIAPAYAAIAPNAPAAKILNTVVQTHNTMRYNHLLQQQALQAAQRQSTMDANNASIYNRRTGMDVSGPFDVALANSSAPDIRNDNAIPSLNDLLQGKSLNMVQGANYDPALVRDYLGQQGAANNYLQKNGGLEDIASGQGASLIRQTLNKMTGGGIGVPSLDPDQPTMLNAGANVSRPGKGIDTNVSPWMYATDVPAQAAGLMKAGLKDAQDKGTLDETNRHNTTSEAETAKNHRATEGIGRTNAQAHMISANKPSAGRAPTLLESMTPAQRQQYLQRQATGNTSPPVVPSASQWTQLKALEMQAKGSDGFLGMGKSAPNEEARQRYNAYAPKYGLSPIPAPFGNKSQSNLQGSKATLSKSIYPGKG